MRTERKILSALLLGTTLFVGAGIALSWSGGDYSNSDRVTTSDTLTATRWNKMVDTLHDLTGNTSIGSGTLCNKAGTACLGASADSRIGTLTAGKTCSSDGTKINCTSDGGGGSGGDNLGNHTATQNIDLAGYQLVNGGTNGLFLGSDGKVGIGTTNPDAERNVYSPGAASLEVDYGLVVKDPESHARSGLLVEGDNKAHIRVFSNNEEASMGIQRGGVSHNAILGFATKGVTHIVNNEPATLSWTIGMSGALATEDFEIYNFNETGGAVRPIYIKKSNGYVGIGDQLSPAYALDVNGTIRGANVSPSDVRLKKDITTLQNSLQKILNLRGVSFFWKDKNKSSDKQIGVIAQEVETEFPELVSTDNEGMKSVNYSTLVAPLIEAVKEQNATITQQEKEQNAIITQQESEITELKARLSALETLVSHQ